MSYQKEIKAHFEKNKEKWFGEIENGKWRNSENFYHHILPKEEEVLNLLETYRDNLIEYLEKKKIKKHIYFHHLNSSQAMCLNFFYPLLAENELDVILMLIGLNEEIDYDNTCFEKASDIEKNKNYRPTSFDFYIKTVSGKNVFFEIKYTEQEFGKAKPDDLHKQKFDNVYKDNLNAIKEKYHDQKVFLENYQILRNLICIAENSYVCFIYPSGNKKIKEQAENAKSKFVKSELKNHFKPLTWESVLDYTEKNVKNESIKKQLKDFKEKYKI
ncbi:MULTISPECIES: PGN_0703 family putative restriction endonuclease [Flavobacterium]|uniref:Uncharacterized protein n=1 Tax=Flavobacterium hankyongi TaxID=1176532 RepID=A0ABP8ZX89_9FLAO|nr:hypothetical protein [Flavobacterium sp. N1846]